ncbi:4-hydroxy-tetrahydrodipicolinate synthase [Psittacicella melopsittaci]|uniref:4-hydroxy-tetrahydrodipicolinate synthase n=1 Tax=Psittacicella melopsittaci TaxID=2028576 RepID=A0A3A1Y424_9GAMM|nr:4-hydroxy-tetrahydrodipicolinate synthase [Psittacicella melopsittaci]RIY32160.1 4-hydroxy-tetrahydrodipicolinate synthase [Psittacicella melopsittaci]
MSNPILRGSIVAIITPLDNQGNVDYQSLKNLVEYHIQSGTKGIVACGTTGEAVTLSDEESLEVIAKVVEFTNKRVPVIAGTGSNCTAKAIAYTKKVEALGVDACLTVVPYYNKPSQEGLYQHFKAIAESTHLPQVLYNVPGRTVTSLDVDTIVRLAQLPNVIAIKDAHPDLHRVGQIVSRTKDLNFIHLSGEDGTALDAIALGSSGVVSVSANVIAREWAEIVDVALQGDYAKALELNRPYEKLHASLFIEPNPTPAKWVAHQLGLIATPNQRLPLLTLSEAGEKKLTQIFTEAKIFK